MKNWQILGVCLALTAGTVSCNKDSDSSNASSAKVIESACSLVSMEEVGAITGASYIDSETSAQKTVGLRLCDYSTDDFGLFQISLTQTADVSSEAGLQEASEYYNAFKENFSETSVKISNLGDDAFYNTGSFGNLYVLYGDYCMSFYIMQDYEASINFTTKWSTDDKKQMLINIAQKALANLKVELKK